MIILPAIDLFGGQAVRLYQGDYNQMTVYDADPLHHPAVLHVQAGDDAFGDHSSSPFPRAMAWARSMAPV